MHKRGQITIFAIIGIVILIIVVLFLFIRTRIYIGPATQVDLEAQFPPIIEHVEDCIIEKAEPRIRQIGLQGGYLDIPQDTFRRYNGQRISYLCYNIADQQPCRTRLLRITDMQNELAEFIKRDMESQCLNIDSFRKLGLDLSHAPLDITVSISEDSVIVKADKRVTLSKGESRAEISEFSALIDLPLGRLYDSSRDIVNSEALTGLFDTLPYSLAKTQLTGQQYTFQKLQPYPDKLYLLKIKDTPTEEDPYIFQFFIQGEPR